MNSLPSSSLFDIYDLIALTIASIFAIFWYRNTPNKYTILRKKLADTKTTEKRFLSGSHQQSGEAQIQERFTYGTFGAQEDDDDLLEWQSDSGKGQHIGQPMPISDHVNITGKAQQNPCRARQILRISDHINITGNAQQNPCSDGQAKTHVKQMHHDGQTKDHNRQGMRDGQMQAHHEIGSHQRNYTALKAHFSGQKINTGRGAATPEQIQAARMGLPLPHLSCNQRFIQNQTKERHMFGNVGQSSHMHDRFGNMSLRQGTYSTCTTPGTQSSYSRSMCSTPDQQSNYSRSKCSTADQDSNWRSSYSRSLCSTPDQQSGFNRSK